MISPSDAPAGSAGAESAGAESAGAGATGLVGRGNAGAACCGRPGVAPGTAGANCSDCEGAVRLMAGGVSSVWGFTTGAAGVTAAGGSADGNSNWAMFDRKPLAGRNSSGGLFALRFRGWFNALP